MGALGCWECSQKDGHAETGGVHQPWHCKPEKCPDKERHAERALAGRYKTAIGAGGSTKHFINGKPAEQTHEQRRCICGLLLIWTPTPSAPQQADQ